MKHESWEQYQVILFFFAPLLLSPMCHLLLLIAAHYHLLLRVFIITNSIRNSRKCQQGNIGVIFSWFIHIRSRSLGLTSKCDRMLLSLIQLMAGLLCTTNCVVFIEKFTQTKQNLCLLKALNHVALLQQIDYYTHFLLLEM